MYPSQGRSRRQRAADPGDSSWADGAHDDGYTHSNRYSQPSGSYDTSPSPHTEYEPRRRPQSSHDRSNAWRRGDEGRGTGDTYSMLSTTSDFHHEGRDDRQDLRPRDSGWPVKDPTSGRPRVESLDNGSKEEPFQESSSWVPPRNDDRSSDVGWTPESSRRAQRGERNNRYRPDDRRGDGRDRDTRKQNGRDDWRTRDDGWGSRVRSDENSNVPSKTQSTVAERVEPASEDRWEPASSWQQNHRGSQSNQRNQYSSNNKSTNKGKGHKKHNHNNKQRRDWRADDGHLNKYVFLMSLKHYIDDILVGPVGSPTAQIKTRGAQGSVNNSIHLLLLEVAVVLRPSHSILDGHPESARHLWTPPSAGAFGNEAPVDEVVAHYPNHGKNILDRSKVGLVRHQYRLAACEALIAEDGHVRDDTVCPLLLAQAEAEVLAKAQDNAPVQCIVCQYPHRLRTFRSH